MLLLLVGGVLNECVCVFFVRVSYFIDVAVDCCGYAKWRLFFFLLLLLWFWLKSSTECCDLLYLVWYSFGIMMMMMMMPTFYSSLDIFGLFFFFSHSFQNVSLLSLVLFMRSTVRILCAKSFIWHWYCLVV